MTDSPWGKPKNPAERSVTAEEAVARFREVGTVYTEGGASDYAHDALGLPVDIGDEVIWPVLGTGTQRIEYRRGQVMDRKGIQMLVFNWATEKRQWVWAERTVAVTRLLKGGER